MDTTKSVVNFEYRKGDRCDMRNVYCIFEDGCSGIFTKQFSESYGYTQDTTLFDAFAALMPQYIYNAWINGECECFAQHSNRGTWKINADDNLLSLLKSCDDETTNAVIHILIIWQ